MGSRGSDVQLSRMGTGGTRLVEINFGVRVNVLREENLPSSCSSLVRVKLCSQHDCDYIKNDCDPILPGFEFKLHAYS